MKLPAFIVFIYAICVFFTGLYDYVEMNRLYWISIESIFAFILLLATILIWQSDPAGLYLSLSTIIILLVCYGWQLILTGVLNIYGLMMVFTLSMAIYLQGIREQLKPKE